MTSMIPGADSDHALVLFSGGQDSTTCLAWALARYPHVETIGFAYGQRHAVELTCREPVRAQLATQALGPDHLVDLTATLGALGAHRADRRPTPDRIAMTAEGLPNTFVPGRNLLFLTCAAAIAYRRGLRRIVAGMCETDYSGYPDCRDDTVKAMQLALNLGMQRRFVLETPLMWRDKAATWELAQTLGGDSAGGVDPHRDTYLLQGRPQPPARLGLWLRRLPCLRLARIRLAPLARRRRLRLESPRSAPTGDIV